MILAQVVGWKLHIYARWSTANISAIVREFARHLPAEVRRAVRL